MAPRIDVTKYPDAVKAMYGLERVAREHGIDRKLLHLIKTRVSQINGCAYCIDMHTKDARAEGETEQRLYGLSAWQETPFYTPRERAALEWAETLTLIGSHHVTDELYARTHEHFTEAELVGLTFAVIAINGWNRLAIPFRAEVGSYQLRHRRGRGGCARVSLSESLAALRHPAGQLRCLPNPSGHQLLVELVVLVDVEVAHFLVLGLAWGKRTQ